MATVWVVPPFDRLEDRHAGPGLAMEHAPVDELAFEGCEELPPNAPRQTNAQVPT